MSPQVAATAEAARAEAVADAQRARSDLATAREELARLTSEVEQVGGHRDALALRVGTRCVSCVWEPFRCVRVLCAGVSRTNVQFGTCARCVYLPFAMRIRVRCCVPLALLFADAGRGTADCDS